MLNWQSAAPAENGLPLWKVCTMHTSSHPAPPDLWDPWQRFLIALDHDGRETLHDLQREARLEGWEARHCQWPHELLTLQAALATETAVRWLRLQEQAWARWLELLADWWREGELQEAALLQPWQPAHLPPNAASTPVALCLDAIEHDLETRAPR